MGWSCFAGHINDTDGLPPTSIEEQMAEVSWQIYPTPTEDGFWIKTELTKAGEMKYEILDIQGRLCRDHFLQSFQPGTHELAVSTKGLAAGVYFVKLTLDSIVQYKKLLIQR